MANSVIQKQGGVVQYINVLNSVTVGTGVSLRVAYYFYNATTATFSCQFDLTGDKSNAFAVLTDLPIAPQRPVYSLASGNPTDAPVTLDENGALIIGGRGAKAQNWYSVSITFAR